VTTTLEHQLKILNSKQCSIFTDNIKQQNDKKHLQNIGNKISIIKFYHAGYTVTLLETKIKREIEE